MEELEYLKEEMNEIKNGKDSFLGIDGGNIESKIWMCGVEFGGNIKKMAKYYDSNSVNCNPIPYRTDCPKGDYASSKYDSYLALFYQVLFNSSNENILDKELYNMDSKIFKLNLFPLAKPDVGWEKSIELDLGIEEGEYYSLYFKNRKNFLKKLVTKYNPKYIICTSTKYYRKEFVEAFFEPQNLNYRWEYLKIGNKNFEISIYNNKQISLIIIPFLGRGNLTSHNEVREMAKYLRKHYLNKELS